jgi:NAD(P)H-flavin reductase
LRLLFRAQDGFSKDLLRYARGHDSVLIRADGPHGAQFPVKFLQVSDFAIVVAGGSGIAVAIPLVWSLMKGLEDPETVADAKTIPRKILLVWIFHDKKHLSWVDPQDLDGLAARGVEVMPCLGRRDIDEIMQSWIHKESRSMQTRAPRTGVVVSGPDSMNREVRNSCAAMASSGHKISVEVEKYGW